jgi:hypothetical protein
MYFGLTNSPATFQTMMDDIFEELISKGNVVVYEVFTLPGIFHMDSIWNGWIPPPFHGFHMDYFLAGSPAIFPFHTHYGFHMECPWNGVFHMDSMDQSMWIPYGIHGMSNEI